MSEKCLVFNKTRKSYLASETEVVRSALRRMKGLIGCPAQAFRRGKGLWILPSKGIHTIGMSFPIDVVYLDYEGRIVRLYHGLAPFRMAALMFKAHSVLELPPGILEGTGTQVGDVLEMVSCPDNE